MAVNNLLGSRRLEGGTVDYLDFEIRGLDRLKFRFRRYRQEARRALRMLASRYATLLRRQAREGINVRSGDLRRAVRKRLARRAPMARLIQSIYYGSFVELGTKHQKEQAYIRRPARELKPDFQEAAYRVLFGDVPRRLGPP